MVAQDVIDRVHTEEMRGAIAVVGEDTSEQWLKYFDSKGFKSMSRVLNHESGKLKTAGEGEVLAATTWAKALGSDGADKNASPTKIQGLTLVERTSQLLEILASMRARLPEAMKRVHAAAGLSTKGDKGAAVPLDPG